MEEAARRRTVLDEYSRDYRPGMVDLSASGAPLRHLAGRLDFNFEELGYVPPTGAPVLRGRIAARYGCDTDDVVLCAGASEGLVALAHAFVRPGDTVAVDDGAYESIRAAVARCGGQLASHDRERVAARLTVLCNPTAPNGRIRRDLARQLQGSPGLVACDEVLRELAHEGPPPPSAVQLDAGAVAIGGLSKTMGLGGLRIGWIVSHDREVLERLDHEVQLLSGGPSALSVGFAEEVMTSYDRWLAETIETVRARSGAIYRLLSQHGWSCRLAEAGLTVAAWPPVPPRASDEAALREHGYFLLRCDALGLPGAYRISLLADPYDLASALELLVPATVAAQPA